MVVRLNLLCWAMFFKWAVFYVNFEHFVKFVFCHGLPNGEFVRF